MHLQASARSAALPLTVAPRRSLVQPSRSPNRSVMSHEVALRQFAAFTTPVPARRRCIIGGGNGRALPMVPPKLGRQAVTHRRNALAESMGVCSRWKGSVWGRVVAGKHHTSVTNPAPPLSRRIVHHVPRAVSTERRHTRAYDQPIRAVSVGKRPALQQRVAAR